MAEPSLTGSEALISTNVDATLFQTTLTIAGGITDSGLLGFLAIRTNTSAIFSDVEWDSGGVNEALSTLSELDNSGTLRATCVQALKVNPTAGTTKTIDVNFGSTASGLQAWFHAVQDLHQTTATDTPVTDASDGGSTVALTGDTNDIGWAAHAIRKGAHSMSVTAGVERENAETGTGNGDVTLVVIEQTTLNGSCTDTGASGIPAAMIGIAYQEAAAVSGRIMSSLVGAGGLAGLGGIAGKGGGLAA